MSRRLLSLIVPWTFLLAFVVGASLWFFLVPAHAPVAPVAVAAEPVEAFIVTPDGHTVLGVWQDPLANVPPPPPLPKIVALTFDDGPHPTHTPVLLEILKRHQVPATFFVLGSRVEQYPALARQIVTSGHQIGNHTWDHADLSSLDTDTIKADLDRTALAVAVATGAVPQVMRPPYGVVTTELQQAAATPLVLWSIDPKDWRDREADTVVQRVEAEIKPGSVILLHDIYGSSVEATERIILSLKAQGYTFVTVDQLFGFDQAPELRIAGVPYYLQTFDDLR